MVIELDIINNSAIGFKNGVIIRGTASLLYSRTKDLAWFAGLSVSRDTSSKGWKTPELHMVTLGEVNSKKKIKNFDVMNGNLTLLVTISSDDNK